MNFFIVVSPPCQITIHGYHDHDPDCDTVQRWFGKDNKENQDSFFMILLPEKLDRNIPFQE